MSENAPASSTSDIPGKPFYDKTREHLVKLLAKKAAITNNLAKLEEDIYKKETEYLEETPGGNIITGFENYTKGTSGGLGGRKRGNAVDANRVFSKSSVSFNVNVDSPMPSAMSTPVATVAPTPLSTNVLRESASNHGTPVSASSANRTGAGQKKKKVGREVFTDSETDTKDGKKRTHFGASRK